jgi:hypothetical protein
VQNRIAWDTDLGSRLTLRKDRHEATLDTRIVHGVGQALILSIDGHWRRMRVFRQWQRLSRREQPNHRTSTPPACNSSLACTSERA